MLHQLILIGGGGHCHACIEVIESTQQYEIVGIIDRPEKIGQRVLGYPIVGTDAHIEAFAKPGISFFITLGHIKTAKVRQNIFDHLTTLQVPMATIVSPHAVVSKHSSIGRGSIVMHRATVGPCVSIGENSIINTGADIEHDSSVGNHSHVSTHAVVNGNCEVGSGVFVGSNSTLFQGVSIASESIVSAGSIVRKSIKKAGVYLHNQFMGHV